MNTALKSGQILDSSFEILDIRYLDEIDAPGIWAVHKKSGAEVYHVYNDDIENLFSFAFATPPSDSTGAAHILEHTVLSGSVSYPLKDAFLTLAQGSLQTFLNAWTQGDKTIYPASSVNEQDYFNLMSVYGDAVFRPLLSEWSFMQEGHRLYFDSGLKISGVVYNEMKGAFSSLDTYAGHWSVKPLMPGTPYEFESGGDPDFIPDLSLQELREFHQRYYTPSNCRIFLAGNIPTEKQLAFLDEKFFSSLPPGKRAAPIIKTQRWDSPKSFVVPCPKGSETKPTVIVSWLCGDITDNEETLSLFALTEILMGHDGSPVTRALIESGLGEDLSPVSGLEANIRETSFCAGIRGLSENSSAKDVEELIFSVLEKLEREGIPEEEIEAALLGMEFSHREIRRSGGPFSLVWMRRSLRAWIYGSKPWESLLFGPYIKKLRNNLEADKKYFEKMIRRYLLDNPHRALITILPKEKFLEEKEAAVELHLKNLENSMTEDQKEALIKKNLDFDRYQEEEDTPENLGLIPHLSRGDLSPQIDSIKREILNAGAVPLMVHPIFTNGISYAELAFPSDTFSPENYIWLPFFIRSLLAMGLPGMDYGEVSSLVARTTGGFHAMLHSSSAAPGSSRAAALPTGIHDIGGRDWIIFRVKSLDEKLDASLDLVFKTITSADFSDHKRLRDLVLEMKNDMDSSLAPSGHHYTSSRSGRLFSRSRIIDDLWSGLDQILFSHYLNKLDIAEISRKLIDIQEKLCRAGLFVKLARGSMDNCDKIIAKYFSSFGPPKPRNMDLYDTSILSSLSQINTIPAGGGMGEVYSSPSLRVGFAGISLKSVPYGSLLQAAELVLSHQFSTGTLWEEIRMKGGAYGAFSQPDHLEGLFTFTTYRDPDPLRSLEAFSSIIGSAEFADNSLEKAVIGTYSRETRPRTPGEKSITDFFRFLYGIEDSHRARRLSSIINVSKEEMNAACKNLANSKDPFFPVIIAGTAAAEKAAKKLGAELKILPV